jgi:hypothetical protein
MASGPELGEEKMDLSGLTFGPIAPIVGAIVGACITAGVTYFVIYKRKVVNFWVSETEDLTLPLRQHHSFVRFRVGDSDLSNLNRGRVVVKNTGNTAIANLAFDIEIPGTHAMHLAEHHATSQKLYQAIQIDWDKPPKTSDPRFHIIVPFLNPKEKFDILVFFDGTTDRCNIHCRIEDVRALVKQGDYFSIFDKDSLRALGKSEGIGWIGGLITALGAMVGVALTKIVLPN